MNLCEPRFLPSQSRTLAMTKPVACSGEMKPEKPECSRREMVAAMTMAHVTQKEHATKTQQAKLEDSTKTQQAKVEDAT